MKLTVYSELQMAKSAEEWAVEPEYYRVIYNYLVHGSEPGSFFSALLSNDWFGAISHSHPSNTIPALKSLSNWIACCCPKSAFGSRENVAAWLACSDNERRRELEAYNLILSESEELMSTLTEPEGSKLSKHHSYLLYQLSSENC